MQIAGPGATVVQMGRRIAVLMRGRHVFNSAGDFRAATVFALVGRKALAFSYDRYAPGHESEALYVAPLYGREREVAAEEYLLGWTRGGELLTWRYHTGLISVYRRTADGTPIGRLGAGLHEVRFDPARRSVFALSRSGLLERYDRRWRRLADLRALGFGKHASFELLADGLIGVLEGAHLAVLHSDGSVFASARFPRSSALSVAGESGLVSNAAGNVVAFAVTTGDTGGGGGPGSETLYLLHAGDHHASRLYSGPLTFAICERGVNLAWHKNWLLYATPEGRTLLLDSRTSGRHINLAPLVHRLAGLDSDGNIDAQIRWSTG